MSIQEELKKDDLTQEAKLKKEIDSLNFKVEILSKRLDLSKNQDYQDWLMNYVSKPLQEAIKTHLHELGTNKSFLGKGEIKTYQKILGWTHELAKEISDLKKEILIRESALLGEEVEGAPENFRPEN